MQHYLALLDYNHLDNTLFLTAFAKALAQHGNRKGIIVHGDSSHTERLIQTGMMRQDAQKRAVRDLNRRMIGLLADEGVSAIGLHGEQKELIRNESGTLVLDHKQLKKLPEIPVLLLSNLVADAGSTSMVPLEKLGPFLAQELGYRLITFTTKMNEENPPKTKEKGKSLVKKIDEQGFNCECINISDFQNWPELSK